MTTKLTAIVLMLCAGTAAGADLSRLFFTPAQRAALDNARRLNSSVEVGNDGTQAPVPPAPPPLPVARNVSIDGVVTRSDGARTVWLNNRAVTGRTAGDLDVAAGKSNSSIRLGVPASGRSVELKVGQSVEIVSGTIAESYSRRPAPKSEPQKAGGKDQTPVVKGESAQTTNPPMPIDKAQDAEARIKELNVQQGPQRNNAEPK